MRNVIQTANQFATTGQAQGNFTAITRNDRIAHVLADALGSVYARIERSWSIARALVRLCVNGVTVVKRSTAAAAMRRQHARLPRLVGEGLRHWLLPSLVPPVECPVS